MGNCCGKSGETALKPGTALTDQSEKMHPDEELPPIPPPQTPTSSVRVYIALYDYDARTDDDLSFKKGDFLEIKPEDCNFDWWMATDRGTNQSGYIPNNYVAEVKTLEAEDWYFGKISRGETQKHLMAEPNVHGSFLIRESESTPNSYALSVRDQDTVRHYKIKNLDAGGYYISKSHEFDTVQTLVDFYFQQSEGLCCKLLSPCVKTEKPQTVGISHNMADKWEVDRTTLTFKKRLGVGNFGEVWEGLWNGTTRVAIKTLKEGTMKPQAFLEEAEIMKKLIHLRLVQLFAVCSREEPIYIVAELMENGSLLEYLRGPDGKKMQMPKLVDIATQVAQGMAYLEKHGYVHRDLAARNVLVGKTLNIKVADFGLSRSVVEDEYVAHEGAKFPIKWTAPEACLTNAFSTKSDVWSYGVLISELVTYGRIPYPGMSNHEVIRKIEEEDYRMPQIPGTPPKLYNDIMLKCWAKEPEERPTFETLSWQLEEFFSDDAQYREADEMTK